MAAVSTVNFSFDGQVLFASFVINTVLLCLLRCCVLRWVQSYP